MSNGKRLKIAIANIIPTNHYIKVPSFTSFRFPLSSIVGLGLVLVVGLGAVLVLFFIAFLPFRCMLKDRKLQPGQVSPPWHSATVFVPPPWHSATVFVPPPWHSATVFVLCLLSHGSNPLRAINFLRFYSVFPNQG